MLISNGWTDDLFPVDEALRFYNHTIATNPDAKISMFFSDHGHQRGQNKAADQALLRERVHSWFDYYLLGEGAEPPQGVETLTTDLRRARPAAPTRPPTGARSRPGRSASAPPARS